MYFFFTISFEKYQFCLNCPSCLTVHCAAMCEFLHVSIKCAKYKMLSKSLGESSYD